MNFNNTTIIHYNDAKNRRTIKFNFSTKISPLTSMTMQKPWSFKAIELLLYVQIGLAFIVSSYGILFLIVREVLTYGHEFFDQMPVLSQAILNYGYGFWGWLVGLLGWTWTGKDIESPDFILISVLFYLPELIVSSVILFVLKTKSIIVVRRTAILILLVKITSNGAIVSLGLPISILPISIFTLCSIFAVAFLSLKPARYLILTAITIAIRVMTIALAISGTKNSYPSVVFLLHYSEDYFYKIFFSIYLLFTILVVAFLFLKPVQQYIHLRS